MKWLIIFFALLFLSCGGDEPSVQADVTRIYIMPLIGGGSRENPRRPKYADLANAYGSIRFGEEGLCLTAMTIEESDHLIISADSDVMVLPQNLDNTLTSGAVSTAQSFLEDHNIPGQWVTTSNTYREVLRITAGVFLFTQRYAKLAGKEQIFLAGVNLDRTVGSLNQTVVNNLQQAADDYDLDYSTVTGSWTLRQLLKHFADQWSEDPINLNVLQI